MMREQGKFLRLLGIDAEQPSVIAVVGGGGKTGLIFRLTEELVNSGKRVIVTTTAHMAPEKDRPFASGGEASLVGEHLRRYRYTVAAALDRESGKLRGLSEKRLAELEKWCDVLLVEADGSRGHSLKVPEQWEPAIPDAAGLVIGVMGLDCLGKPLREAAHRPERTARFLEKSLDAPAAPEDLVKIALSPEGLFRNRGRREGRVYLNKTDLLVDPEPVRWISEELARCRISSAWASLRMEDAYCGKREAKRL